MTENVEITHKKTKKSRTIWVLSAISLVYIGIVYLLIKETATCDKVAISANWFKGFWDQYLGCRSVNELGDTLAGAFAPVAFLWLMGAVFIQSQELKAQREELDETQGVMRAQLEVSIQQVEETKASTALFKKQTEILEKEQRLRDQKESDALFDSHIASMVTAYRKNYVSSDLAFVLLNAKPDERGRYHVNWGSSSLPDPNKIDPRIPTINILKFLNDFGLADPEKYLLLHWHNEGLYSDLIERTEALSELVSSLSKSHRAYADSLELETMRNELMSLRSELKGRKRAKIKISS